ncbi:MAG: hypothetical protein ABI045_01915 [Flavobacteriales bacterium]
MSDFTSNELERLLILEEARFVRLVLILFHIELETVYEEFEQFQDNDLITSHPLKKKGEVTELMGRLLGSIRRYGTRRVIISSPWMCFLIRSLWRVR